MIRKRDKRKSPERFGDKDVGNLAVLHKVLSQFIGRHVLCAAANKDFTIIGTRLQDRQQKPEISCRCGILLFFSLSQFSVLDSHHKNTPD